MFHFLLGRPLLVEELGASFVTAFRDGYSEVLLSSTLPICVEGNNPEGEGSDKDSDTSSVIVGNRYEEDVIDLGDNVK